MVDGRRLHFTAVAGDFADRESGSRWNVLGQAIAGPMKGRRLARIDHVDTFWFAWVAFTPETEILR
ncbi:hypothetical protein GCM10010404_39290 [Nonomuraea africana]|uniref:DUF3179 domain-containing protein n=1 Tax=Nonomuraea africana TaxID=46171 RepID=A0ABR9KWC4_9ACTN|nr:DUF3179 domain-containing (seleno)protein [Nonomuraea africana]MBE1565933.1 hypothetical protein [Nonomuraea africana]